MADLIPVWHGGMIGTYLCALRDCEPFSTRAAPPLPEPDDDLTIDRIVRVLQSHPENVSTLATRLHDSGGDIAKAIKELETSGRVVRVQPALFDVGPRRGELYAAR